MDSITRNDAKTLGEAAALALQEVAEMHGLVIEVKGGTYDAGMFKPNITFKTANADEAEYNLYREMEDLPEFGTTFTSRGREFKIVGFAPRSTTRPIIALEIATGRKFKFTKGSVSHVAAAAPVVTTTEDKVYNLTVDGEIIKSSKSKASLQSFRSKNKTGGEIA